MAALGNHEFYPVNIMTLETKDPVMDLLGDVFDDYLDDKAKATFANYGFFSMKVPIDSPEWENVRVISINNEQCNDMNFYLWGVLDDPNGQIEWLESELAKAEAKGEMVIMIAHIPPGSCLHTFGEHWRGLLERYQHVVRAQYYGHYHNENFKI